MNRKLEETLEKVRDTRAELNDARANVANITGLQQNLFANLTRDAVSMLKFFVNDTTESEGKERCVEEKGRWMVSLTAVLVISLWEYSLTEQL